MHIPTLLLAIPVIGPGCTSGTSSTDAGPEDLVDAKSVDPIDADLVDAAPDAAPLACESLPDAAPTDPQVACNPAEQLLHPLRKPLHRQHRSVCPRLVNPADPQNSDVKDICLGLFRGCISQAEEDAGLLDPATPFVLPGGSPYLSPEKAELHLFLASRRELVPLDAITAAP